MAKKLLHATSAEPTEVEELSGHVLGIIGAYGLGAGPDARELKLNTAPVAPPPEPVLVPGQGDNSDGVHHVVH